ncbi:MAG: D-alanine--D-alanine ligase family protein [Vicinamibacterales bacterium]
MKRLRVGVIYGGRSGEHEVSLASAAAVFANLDRDRYEPVPIRIEKDGRWSLADRPPAALAAAEVIEHARLEAARPVRASREVHLLPRPSEETMVAIDRKEGDASKAVLTGLGLDMVFPVLHGPYGEDGTIQGLLELANVPYVGCGVLASAVGMDKAVMKVLFAARGLRVSESITVTGAQWATSRDAIARQAADTLGFPLFVKPANLGSSVGISKAHDAGELGPAIDLAAGFDRKIVIEKAVPDAREIEVAVLGNDEPEASVAGEIIPSREFYDYEAKYLDEGSRSIIPADLDPDIAADVRRQAIEAFRAIDGAGMARVDFLLPRGTREIFVNEVNTIPGFTTISMFSKLWEASGVPYPVLLDRLIALGIARHTEKQQLKTSVL